ncbi:alpha/beta fold hydrolase [Corynebacterium lizhenjunii]|uniref:alpha/beta fold hydrolase n=1 Tax=Corynebacterium lizhenjunii TaxID=2709394 RepID=UPI0013EE0961|nr:alpha/beta hydrolase [Corynebacterium lizhenjunii]
MASTPALPPSVVELDGPWRHEYLHTRGLRLHAATLGDPSRPLILCLHGSLGGWFDYQYVLEPLAAAGYHVAALDLRGYGLSDKPPVALGQDIRVLIGDVTGAIQALGHDRAVLVGNDTSAGLAWATACERPERVAGVVSISGAHPRDLRRAMRARPWDFGWLLLRTLLVRLPLVRLAPWGMLTDTELRLNVAGDSPRVRETAALRGQARLIGNTFRGFLWNHRLLTAPVPQLSSMLADAPVLFLHANQRLWGPVLRRARRRARQLQPAHVAGSKNLPHIEQPEEFVAVVRDWLAQEGL